MTTWEELWDAPQQRPAPTGPLLPPGDASAYALAALAREAELVRHAPEGTRNDTLNRAAFNLAQLVEAGHLAEADVRDHLEQAGRQAGLSELEIRRTLRSGVTGGRRSGPRAVEALDHGCKVTETTLDDILGVAAPLPATEDPAGHPFWDARPVHSHIRQFAYARMCSPWAVLGVVLLRVLATVPPHVVLPALIGGHGSLNLFCGLVAPSGGGKGASEAAAADCVSLPESVLRAPVGSGEGLSHLYVRRDKKTGDVEQVNTSVLFSVPEVDTLTALGGRQGATLLTQLRSAFSGEELGFSYADPTRRMPVKEHSYRLGMTVGIQPDKAGPLLDDSDGGTPQRFIWLPATDAGITNNPPPEPQPWPIPGRMWGGMHALSITGFRTIQVPDEVVAVIRDAHAARGRGEGEALDGHALFSREKVAVALAVLDGRTDMSLEDWELSGHVMAMSDWTRTQIQARLTVKARQADEARADRDARIADRTEEAREEKALKRVGRALVRRLANGEMTLGDLRRKTTSRDRGFVEDAIHRLVDAGVVATREAHESVLVRLLEGGGSGE
ncbi:hypothetical protein [uncultured Citricoccus sp.]|uniref:hypothetical protein n=1 Tax=uncultured Citricoccus sp. TaxID=614031 RepID=UPI002628D219|nr:hypothetical protein [uncultured Citricoccus sp.]